MSESTLKRAFEYGYSAFGFHIPPRMMGGLRRYIERGTPPGDFLRHVLCNNLMDALKHADRENQQNLPAYGYFLYNVAPALCSGSKEKYEAWIAHNGLEYVDETREEKFVNMGKAMNEEIERRREKYHD